MNVINTTEKNMLNKFTFYFECSKTWKNHFAGNLLLVCKYLMLVCCVFNLKWQYFLIEIEIDETKKRICRKKCHQFGKKAKNWSDGDETRVRKMIFGWQLWIRLHDFMQWFFFLSNKCNMFEEFWHVGTPSDRLSAHLGLLNKKKQTLLIHVIEINCLIYFSVEKSGKITTLSKIISHLIWNKMVSIDNTPIVKFVSVDFVCFWKLQLKLFLNHFNVLVLHHTTYVYMSVCVCT